MIKNKTVQAYFSMIADDSHADWEWMGNMVASMIGMLLETEAELPDSERWLLAFAAQSVGDHAVYFNSIHGLIVKEAEKLGISDRDRIELLGMMDEAPAAFDTLCCFNADDAEPYL